MPHILSNCSECFYLDGFPLTHFVNEDYKEDLDKLEALESGELVKKLNVPREICIKIIKDSNKVSKCSFCNNKLCLKHTERAKKYGKKYNQRDCIMCDRCCWWEIN